MKCMTFYKYTVIELTQQSWDPKVSQYKITESSNSLLDEDGDKYAFVVRRRFGEHNLS
jgi:hypothetical protein